MSGVFCASLFCVSADLEVASPKNLTEILRIFSSVISEPEQGRESNPFHLLQYYYSLKCNYSSKILKFF
jgi:hypothetical protein